jgi:hypothetical protein
MAAMRESKRRLPATLPCMVMLLSSSASRQGRAQEPEEESNPWHRVEAAARASTFEGFKECAEAGLNRLSPREFPLPGEITLEPDHLGTFMARPGLIAEPSARQED